MSEFVKLPSGMIINVSQIASVTPLKRDIWGKPNIDINYPGMATEAGSDRLSDVDMHAFLSYMDGRVIIIAAPTSPATSALQEDVQLSVTYPPLCMICEEHPARPGTSDCEDCARRSEPRGNGGQE